MKKLKLVALLAVLALTVATFVTMLVMPASAATEYADASTDANLYEFDSDATATNSTNKCIGRFGDTAGGKVYVKSIAAVETYLGQSGYTTFNLLTNVSLSSRADWMFNSSAKSCVFNGNGNTIRSTGGTQIARVGGALTFKNITFKAPGNCLQLQGTNVTGFAVGADVVFGSGVTVKTEGASTTAIHMNGGTFELNGGTISGNTTANLVQMNQTGATHVIKITSGTVTNSGTGNALGHTSSALKGTIVISGGTITSGGRLIYTNASNANASDNFNITISGGTLTTNTSSAIHIARSNTKLNITGNARITAKNCIYLDGTASQGVEMNIYPDANGNAPTLTCYDKSTKADTGAMNNDGKCIYDTGTDNTVLKISGGTFNGDGTFLVVDGSGVNKFKAYISGNVNVTTARDSRGFIQHPSGNNCEFYVSGGSITSAGFGIVAYGTNAKYEITGGTIKAVDNNFIHLNDGSGQQVKIGGTAKIICGASESDYTKNLIYAGIAGVKSVTIDGGEIYCGDIYETGGTTDLAVDVKDGTIYCENALCSAGKNAGGVLNISGGDITCTNGALYVTEGNALLNIYDGAKINAKSLVRVRYKNAATGDTAATGCGRLRMFGGNITTTSDAISLELNTDGDVAFTSDIEIYGGTITAPNNQLIDVNKGGSGHIAIYGGEFKAKGRIASLITGPLTSVTLDIYGGTFKSLYNSTDDGADHNITTGIVFISSAQAEINVYGGRFYILTDLNDITKLAGTGSHLVAWAGAIDKINFYGGEFFGGTHVQQRLMNTSSAVDTSKSTYIEMTNGGYFASPVTRDGASIRVSADSMGIRFQSSISKAVLDRAKTFGTVKYGTIITPLDFGMKLGAGLLNSSANYVKIEATSAGTTTDANGNVTFNAALTNILEANLGREFVACAYIEITKADGEVVTIYAVDKAIRSIDQVAKAALADYKTDAEITEGDKTTYKYMTTIYCDKATKEVVYGGTPVYTRFNNAQVAAIAKQMVLG